MNSNSNKNNLFNYDENNNLRKNYDYINDMPRKKLNFNDEINIHNNIQNYKSMGYNSQNNFSDQKLYLYKSKKN